tara:strand:+ start:20458 stop:20910 length:453 start_codon:yes stop_codon:yes gene_type:complete
MTNQGLVFCSQCKADIANEATFSRYCGSTEINVKSGLRIAFSNILFWLVEWNGRIGRLEVLMGIVCLCFAFILTFAGLYFIELIYSFFTGNDFPDWHSKFITLFFIWSYFAIWKKRAQDRGLSVWWLFVPGIMLYLHFVPSRPLEFGDFR